MDQENDLTRAAEELTTYAAQRLVGFERQIPGNAFHHPEARNEWIRDILRGMAEVSGGDGDPLIQAFDRRLDDAHGCFAVEMLDQAGQKHIVQALRQYATALERPGNDRLCGCRICWRICPPICNGTLAPSGSTPQGIRWKVSSGV